MVARLDGLLDFMDIVSVPSPGEMAGTGAPMRSRLRLLSTDRWITRTENKTKY